MSIWNVEELLRKISPYNFALGFVSHSFDCLFFLHPPTNVPGRALAIASSLLLLLSPLPSSPFTPISPFVIQP
jgi:hypothetical protein